MSILDLQRRYRELGRLRIGDTVETDSGKTRPVRLETWRLTSPSRDLIEAAAATYGGTAQVWDDAPTEGEQFEVTTDAEVLDVMVPPQDLAASQYLELWSAGGAKRRCDGRTELISGKPCLCDPDARECSPTTHLLVMLPQLPDVGVWRVTTRSWYAGAELPGTVELLRRLAESGAIPAAQLRIESRTKVRDGKTRHFTLPVLEVTWSVAQAEREGIPVLRRSERPALPDTPPALPDDASFDRDRAGWGETPSLPQSGDDAAAEPSKADGLGEGPKAEDGSAAWRRYREAAEALGDPAAVRHVSMAVVRQRKWNHVWPPSESWPDEPLAILAAALEDAAAKAAQTELPAG